MSGPPQSLLSFSDVGLRFGVGRPPAVRNVDLAIGEGRFVAVTGPSGCGKSTLLNLAMGLTRPSRGSVSFKGRPVTDINTEAAYITQDARLLPWMTVERNISLALKLHGAPAGQRPARVAEWIARVGLTGFERHYPHELSGGMQKRASIARGLVSDPTIVLMDEPFGPLDAITRLRLQQDLLDMWENDVRTVVFVTHDLGEAVALADEIVVMSRGPGTIRGIVQNPIPRPRDVARISESPEFGEVHRALWTLFRSEID